MPAKIYLTRKFELMRSIKVFLPPGRGLVQRSPSPARRELLVRDLVGLEGIEGRVRWMAMSARPLHSEHRLKNTQQLIQHSL